MRQLRADRIGSHRTQFEKNKKRILAGYMRKRQQTQYLYDFTKVTYLEPICNLICNLRKDDDL